MACSLLFDENSCLPIIFIRSVGDRADPVHAGYPAIFALSTGLMLANQPKELLELEVMAAKLLATVRNLPPGEIRHGILKEIGRLRARMGRLRKENPHSDQTTARPRGRPARRSRSS